MNDQIGKAGRAGGHQYRAQVERDADIHQAAAEPRPGQLDLEVQYRSVQYPGSNLVIEVEHRWHGHRIADPDEHYRKRQVGVEPDGEEGSGNHLERHRYKCQENTDQERPGDAVAIDVPQVGFMKDIPEEVQRLDRAHPFRRW